MTQRFLVQRWWLVDVQAPRLVHLLASDVFITDLVRIEAVLDEKHGGGRRGIVQVSAHGGLSAGTAGGKKICARDIAAYVHDQRRSDG